MFGPSKSIKRHVIIKCTPMTYKKEGAQKAMRYSQVPAF